MHPSVHSNTIYSSQAIEATSVSTDEWIKNMWHIHNGILLSHEKERNIAVCSNMDGVGGHDAKWNKSDRERQILYAVWYHLYVDLKNTTN